MKTNPTSASLWIGLDIQTQSGPLLQPTHVSFWTPQAFAQIQPEEPYLYNTDALLGLSSYLLYFHAHQRSPLQLLSQDKIRSWWSQLEPHYELFDRARERIHVFRNSTTASAAASTISPSNLSSPSKESLPERRTQELLKSFHVNFLQNLSECITEEGFDLLGFSRWIPMMDELEQSLRKPLLFNFELNLDPSLFEVFHHIHSFLFNLRCLIAMDYNAQVREPTFEAIKVDSITDYLGKADYIVNDALLIESMIQLKTQGKDEHSPLASDESSEFWRELHHIFRSYAYSGLLLLENIPREKLNSMPDSAKEEFLYMAQMDWLLGTLGGTLFRIREELYGLQRSYVDVFWPELQIKSAQKGEPIQINCFLKAA